MCQFRGDELWMVEWRPFLYTQPPPNLWNQFIDFTDWEEVVFSLVGDPTVIPPPNLLNQVNWFNKLGGGVTLYYTSSQFVNSISWINKLGGVLLWSSSQFVNSSNWIYKLGGGRRNVSISRSMNMDGRLTSILRHTLTTPPSLSLEEG